MPKIPKQPDIEICRWPKHRNVPWTEVVQEDRPYMEWLVSEGGPPMTDEQYDFIMEVLENDTGIF